MPLCQSGPMKEDIAVAACMAVIALKSHQNQTFKMSHLIKKKLNQQTLIFTNMTLNQLKLLNETFLFCKLSDSSIII
jgi:hypothetical protein